MKITVIGCGRWGSCIAWYLDKIGHNVTVYSKMDNNNTISLFNTRTNGIVTFPESVKLETSIDVALDSPDVIVISINSQGLRSLIKEINEKGVKNAIFVLCMKGIEIETGERLSEIASKGLDESNRVAVWLGPGHPQEFCAGIPNCMVIDSADENVKNKLVNEFSSDLIRFYYGADLIGNEVGAASKNVIGIAAGILDGLNLSTLKGALMSRGTREISRLISALGGNELSAYGLCHLGDYEATVFSKFSHNRMFGEMIVRGEKYDQLAEGYYTVAALINLSKKYQVELPICNAVYDVLYNGERAESAMSKLFERSLKKEF